MERRRRPLAQAADRAGHLARHRHGRGEGVTEVGDGRPVEGSKVWSMDCRKDLPYTATIRVGMRWRKRRR